MSKKHSRKATPLPRGRNRNIRIRSQLRAEPDINRIARTVLAMALAQAEKEAQEEAAKSQAEGQDRDSQGTS
ncbi:hypothetical protein [Rhodococcoides corynebacterioides]|uniref:hypothetical protein n=1 Tax=Rhodococcoides corynebacterioides TaxID=53972 RepID=UPI001C9A8F00|nr:hypothetical protein [Rhodococcus corynebacterioides]MBY6349832.1 hypothetical protein [Rhodococcus corynebacterioides]